MQFHRLHPFSLRELSETTPNALRLTVYAPDWQSARFNVVG